MATRDKALSFKVSEAEKRAIREAAADADESVSSFARRQILDGVTVENTAVYDGRMPPLKDFMTARLTVDETADPVAKAEVYERYVTFCDSAYPDHDVESQHKVSREIAAMPEVESGRAYLSLDNPDPSQTRCFKNLRLTTPLE